jgi:hypothetical protein
MKCLGNFPIPLSSELSSMAALVTTANPGSTVDSAMAAADIPDAQMVLLQHVPWENDLEAWAYNGLHGSLAMDLRYTGTRNSQLRFSVCFVSIDKFYRRKDVPNYYVEYKSATCKDGQGSGG